MSSKEVDVDYYTTFGISPFELIERYNGATFDEWAPINHYEVQRSPRGAQHVIFFSLFEHSQNPKTRDFEQTLDAYDYVSNHIDTNNSLFLLEGSARKSPSSFSDAETFEAFGEMGLLEAKLRKAGHAEPELAWPEPSESVVQRIAEEHGAKLMLWYLMLRKFPQLIEGKWGAPYPSLTLYLLHHTFAKAVDLSSVPSYEHASSSLQAWWDERHPDELHMKPGRAATVELVAAVRRKTTLLPCLAVPPQERDEIEALTIAFNLYRQLGFAAALQAGLRAGKDIVFAGGRVHQLALSSWLTKNFDLARK